MILKLLIAVLLVVQLSCVRHNPVDFSKLKQFMDGWHKCIRISNCPSVRVFTCGRKANGSTQDYKNPCDACLNAEVMQVKLGACNQAKH